ncbi:MAG: hypothetical protein WA728_09005, partial [Xanthobacteraceae bacterium]
LREAMGDAEWERSDPDKLWRQDAKLRRTLYPILADIGEALMGALAVMLLMRWAIQRRTR